MQMHVCMHTWMCVHPPHPPQGSQRQREAAEAARAARSWSPSAAQGIQKHSTRGQSPTHLQTLSGILRPQ